KVAAGDWRRAGRRSSSRPIRCGSAPETGDDRCSTSDSRRRGTASYRAWRAGSTWSRTSGRRPSVRSGSRSCRARARPEWATSSRSESSAGTRESVRSGRRRPDTSHVDGVTDLPGDLARALVAHSRDGLVVLNADGTVRYASPWADTMLGYGLGETVGRDAFELV